MVDKADFGEFAASSAGALKRTAFLLTGDSQLAEDLVQATLLRLYERWSRAAVWESPVAYARTTMYSIFVTWHRRRPLKEIPFADLPDRPQPDNAEARATSRIVLAALQQLPARQRAVVVLRFYEGLDAPEIGAILNCTAVTVRTQQHRALARLRTFEEIASLLESERT
jgi:RNA polymerase sigma-70 factor (sigma-E family)